MRETPSDLTGFAQAPVRSWPAYPVYKPSGIEWLGHIPAHWEIRYLKYMADFINGVAFKPDDWGDEGVPILRIENLNGGGTFNYTTREVDHRYHVAKGDIVFGWSGNRGTSFGPFWWQKDGLFYLNQHIFRLDGIRADKAWFFWMLKAVTAHVESRAHGIIGLVHITRPELGSIKVPLPPEAEQQAIATFIETQTVRLDALVAKHERLIELLQEKRTALISHAVTKGLDPSAPMKDSGVPWLGQVPAHWEVKRLKHITAILRGKFTHRPRNDPSLYDGPYPFIQTGDVAAANKYITTYEQTLNEAGFAVSKQFPSGTLVMTIAANIGNVAILKFSACFPDSIVGLVPTPSVELDYLYWQLAAMTEEMKSTAVQNTQLNLNIERIGDLDAACPPLSEQQAITAYLDRETAKLDALIARVRQGIEKLREYRAALVSAAVTGKIDVMSA